MVKNQTEMNKKNFLRAYWFSFVSPGLMTFVSLVLLVALALIARFFYLLTTGGVTNTRDALYFIAFIVLFLFLLFNIIYLQPSGIFRRIKQGVNTYTFDADGFEVEVARPAKTTTARFGYGAVRMSHEGKDAFFIAIFKGPVYMVDKGGFTEGTAGELSAFLKKKR